MERGRYATELLAAAGASGAKLAAAPELEATLERLIGDARAAWPDVALDSSRFVRHLATHLPDEVSELELLHAADLYLACACLEGDRRALAHFERRFLDRIPVYVAKMRGSETFADDVRQLLSEKLFVAQGGARPKIADYSGSGALEGWMRVAAVRTAQNLVRRPKPNVSLADDDALALPNHAPDPELDYLRTRYASEFRAVFQDILASLPSKEKNLLSLYFLDGLRSAAIGKLYGVHGATVRRWIEQARAGLLRDTRARLRKQLRLGESEFESLMGLIQSALDLSISRYLRQDGKGP